MDKVTEILQERKDQYGEFKTNVDRIEQFYRLIKIYSKFDGNPSIKHSIFSVLLGLKLARLYHIVRKSNLKVPDGILNEDSYLDLQGYIRLIISNYPDIKIKSNSSSYTPIQRELLIEFDRLVAEIKKEYENKKA